MRLILPPATLKGMASIPQRDQEALIAKVEVFAAAPFERHPWVQKLEGRDDVVRVRQGDWRAVCRIDRAENTVVVDLVAHRREVYRR